MQRRSPPFGVRPICEGMMLKASPSSTTSRFQDFTPIPQNLREDMLRMNNFA
jgi:hypothetical protein